MSCKAATKDKKTSFGKKLFRRGSVRSVGSFMSRVLRTLTALSHFGSEVQTEDDKDDGGFSTFKSGAKDAPMEDGDLGVFLSGERVPGVAGLKNHGNTCFMNAILQCLSNTELFAEYLVLEQYKEEGLDEDKPKTNGVHLQKKGPQAKGEVTEQLSGLVRALWTFEYTPQHSRDFKNVVSKNATQFKGNAQHDAQEFLLWLLDRVHEDLNTVNPIGRPTIKPPIEEDDQHAEGPSPPLSAGSFVQELFQAQYRSSLTCPHCQKQSNTFDPFLCISLPIPLPHTRPLYVTVVYQGKYSHCLRIGVAVPLNSTVYRLRDAVSRETKMLMDQFILTEMYYDGFHRSFCDDDDDLDIIQESDSIFAFETPETFKLESLRTKRGSLLANLNHNNLKYGTENGRTPSFMQGAGTPVVSPNKNLAPEKMVLLVCNRACTGHQAKRFGLPFVLYMERAATWDTLQKEILEKMRHLLRPGVYIQVGPFSLRVVGVVGITYLLPQDERPLCHPTVERAYKSCGQGGPPHVKIVVEWDKETKDYLFGHTEEEYIPDAESVYLHREQHHHPQACTLAQCFQLYTKEEQLAPDDAWRCPHCKQLQQGRIKLSLWTLPDVLILHLKRFRQEGDRRVKMQNMVRFPLMGMDMAPHVVKRSQSSWSLPSHWSPWRRPYGLGRNPDDFLYDLYAVCNHHGSMHGGHYTAYCKNSVDGQWYCFDDSEVSPVGDDDVCQQTAYILFYQRRTAIPSWSANSSVAGSTSSSLCDHWINRLPGSRPASLASGASSRRTSLASLAESVEFTGERSEDDGGFSVRPFVRSIQRQSLSSRSSMASPLAYSDSSIKPSWSLSAKLQMRSNSPSRFSLDSRCSPPLERIGEACDDRVSTSCFGSYSRHERYFGSRTPLSAVESNYSEQDNNKRFLDMMYCRAPTPVEKKTSKNEPTENNNQITAIDQNILPSQATPSKEQKRKSSIGGFASKAESTGSTKTTKAEQEKTSKKRLCSTHKPSSSETPSSTPVKGKKVSNAKEKSITGKKSTSTPSGTPSKKKETPPPLEATPQHRLCVRSTPQSSASPSPTTKKNPGVPEKNPASGRKCLVERSFSRDSMHTSPLVNSPRGSSAARSSFSKTAESSRPERRTVRSSSSSSSVTSLRSPSVSTRDLQRSSKSEEKGLSFFKSALRQRESRRSADLGKSSLLFKRASERSCKQNGQAKEAGVENGKTADTASQPPLADVQRAAAEKKCEAKESSKAAGSIGRSLLHLGKSKSSSSDASLKSPANGKKPLERKTSSRKLSSSMQSPARATQRPQ
ncbi:ubiquitin carboxyl-terminal hydrolase 31 [Dunckerocampus dactyliophorus]|uniref:ubiquitin carboxyl-terminal hydrolase 31 n=1 Tax=Dunckerocampus dactyliophorus TaxID=161453 RepID=UPI0024049A36|nr:ubiquitin carboxyl-terminal hydrolase 31 [Dunckerocampus dactyliophorus]XP_054615346.1 ubiquitin carboxyl-terminal hydrolase 31 [Dunckerocampus dactyliophorus]